MNQDLGRCLLKVRRLERGWSQQQLADATGFDFKEVSFWETNRRTMSIRNCFIVANTLRCDPRSLYENGHILLRRVAK